MKWELRANSLFRRTLPFEMSDFQYAQIVQFAKEHKNERMELRALLPESRHQRNWLEGGLIPLFVFWTGRDWNDWRVREDAREDIMREANGELRVNALSGKTEKYARSSKGRDNLNKVCEWLLDYLTEQYAVPDEAIDPKKYKVWRDTIYPAGGPDDYISYLLEIGVIKR